MADDIAGLIANLPKGKQRGSLPRCLMLTHGDDIRVARAINDLVAGYATIDPARHRWGPRGFHESEEHQLHRSPLVGAELRNALSNWWFAVQSPLARSPNWDLVAQATIGGREGLVLVEAKAHAAELKVGGKRLTSSSNPKNHARIISAIVEARDQLEKLRPGWRISAGSHYQLANRFAWSWFLASHGVPVLLVYLGFRDASDMESEGAPIRDDAHWAEIIAGYDAGLVPADIWQNPLNVGGVPLIALQRTIPISFPSARTQG